MSGCGWREQEEGVPPTTLSSLSSSLGMSSAAAPAPTSSSGREKVTITARATQELTEQRAAKHESRHLQAQEDLMALLARPLESDSEKADQAQREQERRLR